MSTSLNEEEEYISIDEEWRDIYEWYKPKSNIKNIPENENMIREKFNKGLRFCKLITVLKDKNEAYREVYGEPENGLEVGNESTKLLTRTWITLIMDKLQDSQYALLFDKRLKVIDEALKESLNGSGRTKVDAMKIFLEHTKKPETQKIEITHTHEVGESLADKLEDTLKLLGSQNKIITPDGEVIDAVLLEE